MTAYDYPAMGIFWSMLWFFLFFIWIMLLFRVFADLFRDKDMGGFTKFLWIIFVIFLPFLGVFVYLITHGRQMGERDLAQAQAQQQAFQQSVRDAAGAAPGTGTADELTKLAGLRDSGVITQAE